MTTFAAAVLKIVGLPPRPPCSRYWML